MPAEIKKHTKRVQEESAILSLDEILVRRFAALGLRVEYAPRR